LTKQNKVTVSKY